MKIQKIHHISIKLIAIFTLLLATTKMAWAQTGNWDSYRATGYDSGTGTEADPYIIKTPEQLAYFAWRVKNRNDRNAYVELGSNIDLAGHWWIPIGPADGGTNPSNCFEGTFNGKGYTISNLNCNWGNVGNEYNRGLFNWLRNTQVKNLIIEGAHFQNNDGTMNHRHMGILAGGTRGTVKIENVIIRNSKIDLTQSTTMNDYWPGIGGLVGIVYDGPTIANCYVDVDIDLRNINKFSKDSYVNQLWAGMIIGGIDNANQVKLKNVYAAGKMRMDADRADNSFGTMTGYSKSPSTSYDDNCQYANAPTYGDANTTLSSYGKQGTQKAFNINDFITSANSYVDNQKDLSRWKITNGKLAFSGVIVTDLTEKYTKNEKKTSYVFTSSDTPSSITWKIDGETVTPDAGVEAPDADSYISQITLDIKKTRRKGEVTAVFEDGAVAITKTFEIYPKKYSVDFYADQYAGGTGTKADPYQISNALELAKLAYDVNNGSTGEKFSGTYFELTADINLEDALWMPIGSYNYKNWRYFAGKLNGKGHTIKGMQIYWDDQDNDWSIWGLFASLKGKSVNESALCSVSNLIIDGASMEKRPDVTPYIQGINAGMIVGEMYPYTEVSNIIIKNSKITDNEETYTSKIDNVFGGVIGNVKRETNVNSGIYRIFNISADVDINLFKNATIEDSKTLIAGAIAQGNLTTGNNQSYNIYPINIYVHGKTIETQSDCNYKLGTITANINPTPSTSESATWYYDNPCPQGATSIRNDGNQKALATFGEEFIKQMNAYIQSNSLTDLNQWVFTSNGGFSFGNTTLELVQTDVNTITATTPGKDGEELYAWYVSQDQQNWTVQKDADNNIIYSHTLTLPYTQYDRYVYAVLQDGTSSSKPILVGKLSFSVTIDDKTTPGTYAIKITNSIWQEDNSKFTFSYQWKDGNADIAGATNSTYTKTATSNNDNINCHVIIKDQNGNIIIEKDVYSATVVYLMPTDTDATTEDIRKGNADWGYSPEKPMKTWKGAYSKLEEKASWTENVIVLIGTSPSTETCSTTDGFGVGKNQNNSSLTEPNWNNAINDGILTRKATITGKWNDIDYKGIIEVGGDGTSINLFADTRFENITFNCTNNQPYDIFFCQYNSLEMGEGIKMTNYKPAPDYGTISGANTASFQIFGGFNNDQRFIQSSKENLEKMEKSLKKEGFSITIKSGHYSTICAGGRQSTPNVNGMMGTPNVPIKCTITLDIERTINDANAKLSNGNTANYDVGIILAGNHEGAMYGDVDIIIRSGKVARIVNGSLGNSRNIGFSYGGKSYTFPNNTFMGRANILLDPSTSRFAQTDESEEVRNARVVVTELYGGSAGRAFDGSGTNTIDNPFYGYSTVTINGGTFTILPASNIGNSNIISGIYGAGAGGKNGIGDDNHYTADNRIAYWNDSKDMVLFGTYNEAKGHLVTYKCYNTDTQTETEVDPAKTNTQIIINGGVFGTDSYPIDGIYAGGSGYMSPDLWSKNKSKNIPAADGGNIYGVKGETVASLTINGGTFYCKNGIFAAGRGTSDYYSRLSTLGYAGTASDYTALGKTYGNVELTINGGTFNCPIFGGGYGVADAKLDNSTTISTLTDMARLYGKSTVNINGGTFYDNIYGGGDMALVEYDGEGSATNVTVSNGADIRGSVYGGGNGRQARSAGSNTIDNDTQKPEEVGKVIGSTSITTIGDSKIAPYIYGDIYGGGNLALVGGDTHVNLYAGNFAGQIFGGGKGLLWDSSSANSQETIGSIRNSADIEGNTSVTLAQDQGGQEEGNDGKKVDQFSINVIWDKLWDKENKTFYTWTDNQTSFYDKGKFINPHNIYGGGNFACKVGTYNADGTVAKNTGSTNVTVLKGMTPFALLNTQEWKNSYGDNKNPHFYVFGGGYGANTTVGSTNVTVDVEGDYGIYNAEINDDNEQLARPFKNAKARNKAKARQADTQAAQNGTINVFDNSKGIPNFTVLGVLGGGYSGIVTGNTMVTVDGNTFIHRVYGGGFGDPASIDDNTTGQVGGNTEVYVQGANIYGDVFGGGAGVAPTSVDATPFTQVASVLGTTMVEVSDDAKVYGKVYGGGDIANVGEYQATKPADYYSQDKLQSISTLDQTPAAYDEENTKACTLISYEAKGYRSFVNIVGGDIFGNVFGGGKGLTLSQSMHYDQVGRINGNTLVHVANTTTNDNSIELTDIDSPIAGNSIDPTGTIVPYIWNRIYGGCAYGTVDGNTLVHIEGGMLGLNVFGGGYGKVDIENDMTDDGSGQSTDSSTLEQVLGKKDTGNTGTYANILGNTKVLIDGGSWIWNKRSDVNGNIQTWTDAEEGNNKICENLDEFKQIAAAINSAKSLDDITDYNALVALSAISNSDDTKEFFDINTGLFKKNHNIFGGGNRACNVGTYTNADGKPMEGTGDAIVEVNHSPLCDVYDSNGNMISLLDPTTLQGLCWYLSSRVTAHPQFSVFGAGYGANTKVGRAFVYARPGARVSSKTGQTLEINGKQYRYINHRVDMKKYYQTETGYWNDFLKVSKEDKKLYYGSSDGGNADGTDNDTKTYARYRASRWAWSLGTPNFTFMEIHGGGFSGYVQGDTYVEADCQLACRNLYGAGLGAKPYTSNDVAFTKGIDYDFGSIDGDSKVFIKSAHISQNVYGGGAGVESVHVNGSEIMDKDSKTGELVDFPNMARVKGKTEVSVFGETINYQNTVRMERTLIYGSVYGGGDVANVGAESTKQKAKQFNRDAYKGSEQRTTLVNIRGGQIFSQIFAGGRGRTQAECADYTQLGGIYGNTCLIVDRPMIRYPYVDTTTGTNYNPTGDGNMAHPAKGTNDDLKPYLWNRIYGGCESGTVYGNTLVAVNDGHLAHNIFGGGWGSCDTTYVNNQPEVAITSANVTGNTNMVITGGDMTLISYWLADKRSWEPSTIIGGKTYSPQYDHNTQKFKINHNIYAGGNTACTVGEKDSNGNLEAGSAEGTTSGNTYLVMTRGLLNDDTQVVTGQNDGVKFFERDEWREVYNKVGSPHFGIFGGGFGENTDILGDTHINIQMQGRGSIDDHAIDIKADEEYKHFLSQYSVMDIIGGGYSGKVEGETHIIGDGGVFCRRVFGGSLYATVKATNIIIKAIDCRDIFGGGLMGDVQKSTNVQVGVKADAPSTGDDAPSETFTNNDIYVHGSIYGGNDVSGYVNVVLDKNGYFLDNGGTGTNINIYGGNIDGNVYGAGNGDYLYALDKAGHTKVTVNEYYPLNPNDPESEKVDLVYTVPMRDNMPSYKAASDAAKIVNINSWRPLTNKVNINIEGEAAEEGKRVIIKGDVYGGGNSATVQKVQKPNVRSNETVGEINLNIGNHVNIGRVFMGSNGDALFTASEDNDFMNKFQRLNGDIEDFSKELNFADTIDWQGDPSNKGISTLWLSTKNEERPLVYPHLLDLYFQPVETDIQGTLKWNGTETGSGLADCIIGTFCCGGNRGNMNVYPYTLAEYSGKADTQASNTQKVGNAFEYTFPAGLTITDKIVGGCNNANYDYKGKVSHEGGYLLGETQSAYPFIKLNIECQFEPTIDTEADAYKGGNVYGGCYKTGTIRGDIAINLKSDMLQGKSQAKLENSNERLATNPDYSTLNVYGAGYGMESYVYGNTHVQMGEGVICQMPSYAKSTSTDESGNVTENKFAATGSSANFVYGGGQQGNVIGVTNVDVLNGHIFKSATGGSYSGYVWGSTQVKVGYPKYYKVKAGKDGIYNLNRADQKNNTDDGKTIKQTINLMAGDLVTEAVYNAIKLESKTDYFEEIPATTPTVGWDNVNIKIGEAVYGGGYSLAQGSSVMANNTTVLKYTQQYNPGTAYIGYGGNTTILIADRAAQPSTESSASGDASTASTSEDRDHIIISRQDMEEAKVAAGQDLLGYYYLGKDGSYHYIYQAGTYYKGGTRPDGAEDGDKVYEYDNEGGVFGDGHLSYAQGFRSADITGYGFAGTTINSPKIINTFQRMDILRLTDNCFSLLGARDYATNATDKTPYSISRVGEIQMQATDNVLTSTSKTVDGTKTTVTGLADNTTFRARNYMGFANNIHYVGALTSNIAFTDTWYDENGKQTTFEGASTYMDVKQKYIDEYYKEEDETKRNKFLFEKRNNGTAKNMIGIASGYALKIQNAQEQADGTEILYYGPIIGVVEMNLIDVREDEGGGYVYADNIHKRSNASDGNEGSNEASGSYDFLETSGNFVFPYSVTQGRYIVDDCFHVGYDALKAENEDPDHAENAPAHYWYVTGFNYHYTAHITGFTYDKEHNFLSNNQDGIVALSGLKGGQEVQIESWKMYSAHNADYPCDLEKRNYSTAEADKEAAGKYILHVSASNNSKAYNEDGFAAQLSMKEGASKADCDTKHETLPAQLTSGDAKIIFQLTDNNVNNNANGYYSKYLSEPCKATLVLSAPALDESQKTLLGKVALSKLYTKGSDGKYTAVVTGKLQEGTTYYYKNGETEKYQELTSEYKYYTRNKDNLVFNEVNRSEVELGASTIYYCEIPRYYTYTIDLTIEYIQGPNITGQITVENCALPGERIRVKKDQLVINADQAFSVNGYYWRIGKREYNAETKKWDFCDKSNWEKDSQAKGYDTFNQSDKEGKGLFKDCRYDMTDDYLEIPAYYYMNGYGIQLGVTMNIEGMENTILPIDMTEADQLVVHNYHRMDPHKEGFDLHLADAIKRVEEGKKADASEADKNFAEPRIYLADQKDLTAFIAFVDSIGANSKSDSQEASSQEVEIPRYGKNAQFILQNDLTMQTSSHDGSSISEFAGTLHGNGHVIHGLAAGNCLFNSISGNVYNLGLSAGKISNMQATNGKIAQYHCCYEYAPNEVGTPIIYKMDGTLNKDYTTEDFRLGKVAYDLNKYYLRARQSNSTEEDKQALKYVYDYFANGDYQYAQRTDAITGKNTGITYLRTGKDSDLPNYEQAESRHDKTHTIDPARHNTETGIDIPLFNAAGNGTEQMNDFLFWGQSLQSTPANYPTTISSHQVSYMANRVYRTAGYYGDTQRGEYHYNAYSHGSNYMDTYVHNPATTAIDFSYKDDNATIFHDFFVKDGVTQNLLVYTGEASIEEASTADEASNKATATDAYSIVSKALSYNETTKESLIHGHHIAKTSSSNASASGSEAGAYSTPLLHLVERTTKDENSEGESSENNNFCAPIAFEVTNHAWYTRKPQYYANDASGAWEGICLPFTVDQTVASLNGEITHFYGKPSEKEENNPAENTHSLHHEYWLRGMMKVENENNTLNASFERPGLATDSLFDVSAAYKATGSTVPSGISSKMSFDYRYNNSFFVDTYGKLQYNQGANPYYADSHTYESYLPLTSGVPYIVRFPGERYYEFDLSSKFYNNLISGRNEPAQTVTFHAYGADSQSDAYHGAVVIPITSTMQGTEASGFQHMGTFSAMKVAEGSIFGMNADGTAFDQASSIRTVMPFRTYIAKASTEHSRASIIKINEGRAIDKIVPEIDRGNGEETTNGEYLIVRPIGGNRVRIECTYATTLNVYSTTGQLQRVLDVQPGTATYSGFRPGIYIFGKTKVLVK